MAKPCRVRATEHAAFYLGEREEPPGSNRGKNIDRWCLWANGVLGEPWCAAFVCGMVREACGLIVPTPGRASVERLEQWAAATGELLTGKTRPRRGDLILYDWNADDWYDHIGFVERVLAIRWLGGRFVGRVRTIEGNTDDAVRRRWRTCDRVKFVRLNAEKLTTAG